MTSAVAEALVEALAPSERDDDPVSERVLDAALESAAANGLDRVTMDEVASRARVGRMTLYRRYGSKPELLRALTVREARRGLAQISSAVDPGRPIADQVADGFAATLKAARESPLLQRMLRFEPERLLATLNDPKDPLFGMMREFGAAQIAAAGVEHPPAEREAVAELLVRIGLSFLLIPRGAIDIDDEQTARELARSTIAPLVEG